MFGSSQTAQKQDIPSENEQDCQLWSSFFPGVSIRAEGPPPGIRQVEAIRKVVEGRNQRYNRYCSRKGPSREMMRTRWQLGLRRPQGLRRKIPQAGEWRICLGSLQQKIWEPS